MERQKDLSILYLSFESNDLHPTMSRTQNPKSSDLKTSRPNYFNYRREPPISDRQIQANIRKSIPLAIADLNKQIFQGKDEHSTIADLGEWTLLDNKLVKAEGLDLEALGVEPKELVEHLLRARKEHIVVR